MPTNLEENSADQVKKIIHIHLKCLFPTTEDSMFGFSTVEELGLGFFDRRRVLFHCSDSMFDY